MEIKIIYLTWFEASQITRMVFKENLGWTQIASFCKIKIKLSQNLENTGLIKDTSLAHKLYILHPVKKCKFDIRCQSCREFLKVSSHLCAV